MNRDWRSFGRLHRWLLELTGGRFFDGVGSGRKVLLLTTIGCKSGEARTTPLVFMPYEDGYVVYASNGGQERPPAWWLNRLNLQAKPDAEVKVRGRRVPVRAASRWSCCARARRAPTEQKYNLPRHNDFTRPAHIRWFAGGDRIQVAMS